jgi:hypothetical protein
MNERPREQLGLLARALFGAAVVVIVGAIQVATSAILMLLLEKGER